MSSRKTEPAHRELATAFQKHRVPLAEALYAAYCEPETGIIGMPQSFHEMDQGDYFLTAVDLAAAWFRSSDPTYERLFSGWVHSNLKDPGFNAGGLEHYRPSMVLDHALTRWISLLSAEFTPQATQLLAQKLGAIVDRLAAPAQKSLRVVYIGDCLIADVIAGLIGECLESRIAIETIYLHHTMHAVLRNQILALDGKIDLVLFSPFSHNFFPEYESILRPKSAFWPRARFFATLDHALDELTLTLRAMASRTQCPIYVHNTGGTLLMSALRLRRWGLYFLSMRNRRDAVSFIRQRLLRIVADPAWEGQVRLLDELRLQQNMSRLALGQSIFDGDLFHPGRLGLELARGPYFDAIYAAAFLADKKVVVCDLDNTLWDGVIGEGAVTHFFDRQQTLKALREHGVLLSINSKNDPAHVHFTGAALQLDDFVATRINWDAKVPNMTSIVDELNLKPEHFVFIDDRPDELERIRNAFPAMLVLDAGEPSTWRRLAEWHAHLSPEQQEDRTRLYHERAAREQFLSSNRSAEESREDEMAALRALHLSVKIEEVSRSGLKRAVELINRTNQFNVAGSRTTLQELETGLGSAHCLLSATVRDKFGSMGVVGIMRVDLHPDRAEIPIFVLSCRVFGFGIEYVLLNSLKGLIPGDRKIVGHYRETQSNKPGRQLYPNSGLSWDGTCWTGKFSDLSADPEWLQIERSFPSSAREYEPTNIA
jgi:FkbH-like protein